MCLFSAQMWITIRVRVMENMKKKSKLLGLFANQNLLKNEEYNSKFGSGGARLCM